MVGLCQGVGQVRALLSCNVVSMGVGGQHVTLVETVSHECVPGKWGVWLLWVIDIPLCVNMS